MNYFDFNDLFIFDLANNHHGDCRHGLKIIKMVGQICQFMGIRGVLKFQFREIESFIHPSYKNNGNYKNITRFTKTYLSQDSFRILIQEVKNQNLLTMVTPFDELSVDILLEMDVNLVKIASCSADDYPLLEKISQNNCKPIVISTGGLDHNQLNRIVNFFRNKKFNFAIMHCISIYPTPDHQLFLNHIEYLKYQFPDITIGFSTHEYPDNVSAIQIAYAKGARIFERHVGIKTDKYPLNDYSSTSDQIKNWILAYKKAVNICGNSKKRLVSLEEKNLYLS